MKLAVFVDQIFWFDGRSYSTDESYILFPASFAAAFDEVVFLGRVAPESMRKPYVLDDPALKVCPLPYYNSVYNFWRAGTRLYKEIQRTIQANIQAWDVIWICGPNPVGQYIARQCMNLGRPVFFVVRQNLPLQIQFMHKGVKQIVAVMVARWMEWRFRHLARDRTVFTVGQEMTDAYQAVTDRVHVHFPCLVGEAQMAELSSSEPQPEPNRLLCVGRLSAEKGYPYLLEALVQLKVQGIVCYLDFVGSGPLEEMLKAQTAALGLSDTVTFKGYVPYGQDLFALYQRAMALVVPSLSEGFPQVIAEALCAGLPTIASAVGGIPGLLTHRETAVLVPPADVPALVEAIKLVLETPEVRERLRANGRALMQVNTLEAQRDRMVQVIQDEILSKRQSDYRSALADYPDGLPPMQPTVAAVVPVYNEINHIKSVVDGLLAQDYPALTEIWFVDGQSNDGTFEALQLVRANDPRVRVLSNPLRNQAAGINLALKQIQSDIVVRLDGHAQYTPSMIRKSVEALLETGAAGVGAIARPLAADTLVSQSIVAAHESQIGVGVAKFRQVSASGCWADTVWNGCYWKYIVDKVGPFREDLPRTEDNDFNARVRALGYGLYLSPDIVAYYYPRQSLRGLWQQYFANGVGVIQTFSETRGAIQWRHLVPLAFVSGLLFLAIVSIFWLPVLSVLMCILLLYLSALIFFSIVAWRKKPGWHVLLLPVVFIILHFSYGLGSLRGLLQQFGRS